MMTPIILLIISVLHQVCSLSVKTPRLVTENTAAAWTSGDFGDFVFENGLLKRVVNVSVNTTVVEDEDMPQITTEETLEKSVNESTTTRDNDKMADIETVEATTYIQNKKEINIDDMKKTEDLEEDLALGIEAPEDTSPNKVMEDQITVTTYRR